MQADGLFIIGTARDVGKTLIGVGLVALLRKMGVDATMMTPISTGGAVESAAALLRKIGVDDPRRLVNPIIFETPAAPMVASRVEERPIDTRRILEAYRELRAQGKFVIVEGGGVLVPIARHYAMIDLLKDFGLPSIIVGRTGRGTINHCLLTQRMMLVMGVHPLGFILNGFGRYGEGFAESLNPDVLRELAAPTPVLATLEWRPEYQADILTFVRAMGQVPELAAFLEGLVQHRSRKVVVQD
jgi:dethiobiotin synthetase